MESSYADYFFHSSFKIVILTSPLEDNIFCEADLFINSFLCNPGALCFIKNIFAFAHEQYINVISQRKDV